MVEHRCLRCGALVGEPEPAASRPTAPAPSDPQSSPAIEALGALKELHASGVLTDDEFAAKKAELLRRV